ncbi:MAG: sulfotransferase [Myxococcota bacterium]|nr:sulfotransferase [Myxococcota bacterium]
MPASDNEVLERPIVIIGPPRSGTSLLMNVLGVHADVVHVNEPRLTWRYGNDGRSDWLRPEHATPAVREHIRREFAARVREGGGRRLVEKTPSNALRPAFVDAVFPDCLFVNILRHPYDTILSIRAGWEGKAAGTKGIRVNRWRNRFRELDPRRAPHYAKELMRRTLPAPLAGVVGRPEWGPRLPGMQGLLVELSVLEVACLQWRACVEISCQYGRALPAERYLEIPLEELTRETMQRVLDFCALSSDEALWQRFESDVDRARAGSRREGASAEDLACIRGMVRPTAEWLGYEL